MHTLFAQPLQGAQRMSFCKAAVVAQAGHLVVSKHCEKSMCCAFVLACGEGQRPDSLLSFAQVDAQACRAADMHPGGRCGRQNAGK